MERIKAIDFQIEELINKANHTTSLKSWIKLNKEIETLKRIKENIIKNER